MLQQTTVNATEDYYRRWIRIFPTVRHVARAPLARILKTWQGLGYYQRARNIHAASKIIVTKHGAKIPRDPEILKRLPGFGPYTVGAVLSIAFNLRYPIIDANVRRVFMRLMAFQSEAKPSCDPEILKNLKKILPERNMKIFNQALMELGALVCRNREPLCVKCPVKRFCKAYERGIQEIIPTPRKMIYKNFDVAIGILRRNNKYFVQKRPSKGLLAGLWEFPGGKIKSKESVASALKREMKEEIHTDIISQKFFMNAVHAYTNNRVKLHVFFCQPHTYPAQDKRHRWVTLRQIENYPMPSGSAKIIERLKQVSV